MAARLDTTHRTLRRWRGLLVAGALAAATVVGVPPASAEPGLAVTAHAQYVIDPHGGPLTVTATVTIRNTTPDTATRYFYYDGYAIPVPAGSQHLAATSEGRTLTVHTEPSDGDPSTEAAWVSFAPLRHGRSRTIVWTFEVPGAPVRSTNMTRVGRGYAAFVVQVPGDRGHVSAEVVAPSSMQLDMSDGEFERRPDGEVIRYVADEVTRDDGLWAVVSARDPLAVDEKTVTVDGSSITLDSFPGDRAWTKFVSKHVTAGIPVLERVVGRPWPGGLESIREDVAPQALQYAWFDRQAHDIVVSEDLDAPTLFHELSHAWFDDRRFDGRWLSEGLAEAVAYRAVTETDGPTKPRPTPNRKAKVALALTAWSDDDKGEFDVEDYAYAASSTAVRQLLGDLDEKTFAAVVSAAYAGESAYEEPGSKVASVGQTDWRRFLDLVEDRGGVTSAEKVYRRWVVDSDQAKQLRDRARSRTAYASVDDADGAWRPPLGLRKDMAAWRFGHADAAVEALDAAPHAAAEVQAAAQAAGLPVPPAVRDAYESAADPEHYTLLASVLERTTQVLPTVGEARDAAAAGHDPVSTLGQVVLGVDRSAGRARAALAHGDVDSAEAAAESALARAHAAPWAGAGLVVLVLAALAGVVVGVRRRRARPQAVPPTAADRDGHDLADGAVVSGEAEPTPAAPRANRPDGAEPAADAVGA